jgi:WD40 repeat protein
VQFLKGGAVGLVGSSGLEGRPDALQVWDLRGGRALATLRATGADRVAATPDGALVVTGGNGHGIQLWDASTWKPVAHLKAHAARIARLVYVAKRKELISGAQDGEFCVWDLAARKRRLRLKQPKSDYIYFIYVASPDGALLATSGEGEADSVTLWDLPTGKAVQSFRPFAGEKRFIASRVEAVEFSPDGKLVACSGSNGSDVGVWDVAARKLAVIPFKDGAWIGPFVPGTALLSIYDGGKILLWDCRANKPRGALAGHGDYVGLWAFSPDGKWCASSDRKGQLILWDVERREVLGHLRGHSKAVLTIAFSPDGRTLLTGGLDCVARVWDLSALQKPRPK